MTAIQTAPQLGGGYRHALRLETREAHDRAEAVFARFHDNPLQEMTWFLSVQRAALIGLAEARIPEENRICEVVLEDLIERLDFDLAHAHVPAVSVTADRPLAGLAVDYLVLGSRLGTKVVRRRLAKLLDHYEMPTYFLAPSAQDLWRRHCQQLNEIAPDGSMARRITDDSIHGFGLFEKAGEAMRV
ncbi:hypothetical protein [Sagittula salina]|uniref:Heme oxygenase n=1 Tax=Sagittula salina TaxID=2820268 RepID=A0A940MQK0_9RHOB|nr:hypothetical protein [Sagittula salina]MBP0482262.1 hypothetical protein [Sagittula salina]